MPIVRISIGRRVFAPSWAMTALTAALCALFVHLGQWQWHKATWRQAEWNAFARGADRAVPLGSRGTRAEPRFQRVVVTGHFDPAHQFLLDNQIEHDEAGYQVLTPLRLDDGRVLLVDRGWVPFTGSRGRLPDVHLAAAGPVTLTGRVDTLPAGGLSFGKAPPPPGRHWPKVTSYPDMPQLAAALRASLVGGETSVPGRLSAAAEPSTAAASSTAAEPSSSRTRADRELRLGPGVRLEPRILLLDPGEPFGYVREWRPPGMSPAKYMSYAAQWWLFAVSLAIIWLVVSAPKVGAAQPHSPPAGREPDPASGPAGDRPPGGEVH